MNDNKQTGQWWDVSWNPITGCAPRSPGCDNCWARQMANRLRGRAGYDSDKPFSVSYHFDRDIPGGKAKKIFVCDMGDLFYNEVNPDAIEQIFVDIESGDGFKAWPHTFIILTKRPSGAIKWLKQSQRLRLPDNVWFGVSCENLEWAEGRIPHLREISARIRFVCYEPLLGPISLAHYQGIGWVIVGCESGPNRRPCKIEWVRQIVDQCRDELVPVWVKQLDIDGRVSRNMEEWPEDLRTREWPSK